MITEGNERVILDVNDREWCNDYPRLRALMQISSIPCTVKSLYGRDIAKTGFVYNFHQKHYSFRIGVPGTNYVYANNPEEFDKQCESMGVRFLPLT